MEKLKSQFGRGARAGKGCARLLIRTSPPWGCFEGPPPGLLLRKVPPLPSWACIIKGSDKRKEGGRWGRKKRGRKGTITRFVKPLSCGVS